jgi:hypothetical protein
MAELTKKRAPLTVPEDMQRAVQQIYDDINEIINAVNYYSLSGENTAGKPGDIRIIKEQDQSTTNYHLEFKTDDGWVRLTGVLIG